MGYCGLQKGWDTERVSDYSSLSVSMALVNYSSKLMVGAVWSPNQISITWELVRNAVSLATPDLLNQKPSGWGRAGCAYYIFQVTLMLLESVRSAVLTPYRAYWWSSSHGIKFWELQENVEPLEGTYGNRVKPDSSLVFYRIPVS